MIPLKTIFSPRDGGHDAYRYHLVGGYWFGIPESHFHTFREDNDRRAPARAPARANVVESIIAGSRSATWLVLQADTGTAHLLVLEAPELGGPPLFQLLTGNDATEVARRGFDAASASLVRTHQREKGEPTEETWDDETSFRVRCDECGTESEPGETDETRIHTYSCSRRAPGFEPSESSWFERTRGL